MTSCADAARPGGAPSLDALLAFDRPAMCRQSAEHGRFLVAMVGGDASRGFRPGRLLVPDHLEEAFGPIEVKRHDDYWTVGVAVRGTLFGLPLDRIDHALPVGGDPGDVTYTFGAPVDEVKPVLGSRGFVGLAVADGPLDQTDGVQFAMSLIPDPENARRSLFGCGSS